jgi:hypothetical protein
MRFEALFRGRLVVHLCPNRQQFVPHIPHRNQLIDTLLLHQGQHQGGVHVQVGKWVQKIRNFPGLSHCSLLIGHFLLLVAHFSLFIAHSSYLIAHCLLLVTHCSLLVSHFQFIIAHCSLFVACCLLLIANCSLLPIIYSLSISGQHHYLVDGRTLILIENVRFQDFPEWKGVERGGDE